MSHRWLSSVLLATSLLAGAACSTTTAGTRADVTRPQAPSIDRAKLRSALEARRQASLDRFLAYRDGRVYPLNSYAPGLQHVWMDEQGHLCAAATLISDDWGRDAAARIAAENNFLKMADVHDGPLADWVLTSGMTHHEIVAIQEPMMYEGPVDEPQYTAEIDRLYGIYTSVERQVHQLWDESLDEAVDALLAHPELAKRFLRGELAGAGKYDEPLRA